MDVLEIIYPRMQILLEVDHSSGHLKEQSDGLMVNAMGMRWGGKTVPKRDSVMEDGCLGSNPPTIKGRQLTLGSVQKMIFEEGDEGPFYEVRALRHDTPMNAEEIVKEKEKRRKRKNVLVTENDVEAEGVVDEIAPDAPYVNQGFEGKNKGIKQVRASFNYLRFQLQYICYIIKIFFRYRYYTREVYMWMECRGDKQLLSRRNMLLLVWRTKFYLITWMPMLF